MVGGQDAVVGKTAFLCLSTHFLASPYNHGQGIGISQSQNSNLVICNSIITSFMVLKYLYSVIKMQILTKQYQTQRPSHKLRNIS